MNADRWRHIEELYQAALEREPGVRVEFLKSACADDSELLSQVEALLTERGSPDRDSEGALSGASAPVFSGLPTVTATGQARGNPGLLGTRLADRYRVAKELGRGGFATVYLAHDEKLALKPVVIKVLDNLKIDKWRLRKFRQEMEALARIDHPGVIAVLDEGQINDGTPFLVIQFVDGVTLRHFVQPPGMDLRRAADLIRQIGSALQAAHSKDVLHRDLKPENIMIQTVDGKDRVKLIDFGIASVAGSQHATTSQSIRIAGTQGYMAPEQFEGKACVESDIFAFGAIAYELLTGQKLIRSPLDLGNMRHGDLKVRPRDLRPELPENAQAIIQKSLSYESSRRYHDAREMGDQLADALSPGDRAASGGTGSSSDQRLELAHVLFLDLVKYSMMDMETQRKSLAELHQVIGAAPHFVAAESAGELIALPTGDGMALLFFGDPTSAAECAVEIARAAKQRPELRMRMGLHTGPVYRVADINQRLNAAGGGINMAQRVMDAGDPGQILVSSAVADVLLQLATWKGRLTDLGEHPVKNGVIIHFYNLCTDDVGSAAWPSRLKEPNSKIARRSIAAVVVVALGIGGAVYLIRGLKSSDANASAVVQASPLQLEYSITVQRYKNRRPFQDPFQLAGEMLFEEDYRIALNIRAPQPGFLYILNEGPLPDGSTSFNLLFPNPAGAAQLNAGQGVRIPQREWFLFDKGYGTEKLYLVWAARAVAEFERAKDMTTLTNGIVVIRDPSNVSALQQDLARYLITASDIRKDEDAKKTLLSSRREVLVHLIRLEHH